MPEIRPFRGLLYRDALDPGRVLAPPYDVIPEAHRQALLARHERNVVRLILAGAPEEQGYAEAGATFSRWREDGTLLEDSEESLYVLEQAFAHDGGTLIRRGLLARFRAEDAFHGRILPHEHTRAAARDDRWRMLLATRANFSPILLMLEDPAGRFDGLLGEQAGDAPLRTFRDDQAVEHKLWRVTEPAAQSAFREALETAKAYIADGHHRYATALRYRDEHGNDGAFTFGYFTPIGAPGLVVLPYHRILSAGPTPAAVRQALSEAFRLTSASSVGDAAALVACSPALHAFALAWRSGDAFVAEAQPAGDAWVPSDEPPSLRALDTFFVHRGVLPRLGVADDAVGYVHSLTEAEEAVARGAVAILMRGTRVEQIVAVAADLESMPAKSTFFHPKLPSGLVIHPLAI